MNLAHLLEAAMLVCFGFSWPINVVKAYRARTAKSTSLAFIILIITGYIAGISAKLINHQFNYVLAVYFLNLVIVFSNVVVYFRNVALDRKSDAEKADTAKSSKEDDNQVVYAHEEMIELKKDVYAKESRKAYNVALMGGTYDTEIPSEEIAEDYELDFDIINRSTFALSLRNAKEYYRKYVAGLASDGMIIHLGEEDKELFKANPSEFDNLYLSLISLIKGNNKNCRLALVSVKNSANEVYVNDMNNHINAIASSEQAVFVNLANASLWNPEESKTSSDFAAGMGLKIKKPIYDVATILYSYADKNLAENAGKISIA